MELISESDYRLIRRDSYSSLKQFRDDRRVYKREYIDWQKRKSVSDDMIMGLLVDAILLGEDVEDKFVISGKIGPTGQMGEFVSALYRRSLEAMNDEGMLTRNFSVVFEEAYNDVAFDKNGNQVALKRNSLEKMLSEFDGGPLQAYYDELVSNTGKTVIDMPTLEKGERAAEKLKNDRHTADIINLQPSDGIEVFNQLALFYTYRDLEIKLLLDKLVVNHKKKLVTPFDLKCTHNIEDFHIPYLKYGYYIQNGIYWKGCTLQPEWEGYEIAPMKFIAADSNSYTRPLVHRTSLMDIDKAFKGFSIGRYAYKGIDELIDEINWHKTHDIWDVSKSNFENNGKLDLIISYE